ncbi:hypothetical protein QL285_084251 [Trifolium repens]|nr:hypothetical protein QL285_084251 [Trifolium repens]
MGDSIEITTEEKPLLPNPPVSEPIPAVSEPNPAEKTTYLVLITIQHIAILGTFLTVERVRAYKEFVDYYHARGMLYGLIYVLEVCSIVAFLRFLCFARAHSHVLEFIFTVGVNLICSTMMINIINSKLWIGNLVVWSIALLIGIIYFSVKSCKQGGRCGRRTCCGCCGRRTCCGCCGRRNSNVNENDVGGGDVAVVVSGSCCEMSSCCAHRTSDGDISCCDVFSCCAPRRTGSDNTDGGGVSDGSCCCDVFSCCAPRRTGSDNTDGGGVSDGSCCCDVFSCCAPRTGSDNTDGGGVSDGSCCCDVFSCCAPRTGSDNTDGGGVSDGSCCCHWISCCAPRTGSDNTDGGGVSDGSCCHGIGSFFCCCATVTPTD